MNNASKQISQYKDAIKLLKKKCQSLETTCNDLKTKNESITTTIYDFLEYETTSFTQTDPRPELSLPSLKSWWDIKKEGIILSEKAEETIVTGDNSISSLQSKIIELNAAVKKLEFEKKDLEFNINRRITEVKASNEKMERIESENESMKKEMESLTDRNNSMESSLENMKNGITSLFLSISQYLDVQNEQADEMKPQVYALAQSLFPAKESSEDTPVEIALINTLDKVVLVRSRYDAINEELRLKNELITSQGKQITDFLAMEENERATITRLREKISAISAIETPTSIQQEESVQMKELEEANEALRVTIKNMKAILDTQARRIEENETHLLNIQNEIVMIQKSNSEMIQQIYKANEDKLRSMEEEKNEIELLYEREQMETSKLHTLLEQGMKQYEQELTVLREKRYMIEEQVNVSEKFLETTNQQHREELSKLNVTKQEYEKEIQGLRITILEKEGELRSAMEGFEVVRQQNLGEIVLLKKEVQRLEERIKEETRNKEEEMDARRKAETGVKNEITERVNEAEQKEREKSRQLQRQYEEELVRVRKQVTVLSHQLEEERKGNRKIRESVNQLHDTITLQEQAMDRLRSEVTTKESELLAGRQQINKLSVILSQKFGDSAGT